jgi:hypothetical protein
MAGSCVHEIRCETVASWRGQEPLNTEAEESTLLGTVTRQQPVKTEKLEDLVYAILNCKLRKLATEL